MEKLEQRANLLVCFHELEVLGQDFVSGPPFWEQA
jgi:hypothetical protein